MSETTTDFRTRIDSIDSSDYRLSKKFFRLSTIDYRLWRSLAGSGLPSPGPEPATVHGNIKNYVNCHRGSPPEIVPGSGLSSWYALSA